MTNCASRRNPAGRFAFSGNMAIASVPQDTLWSSLRTTSQALLPHLRIPPCPKVELTHMAGRLGASEDNVIWGVDFTKDRELTLADLHRAMMAVSSRPLTSPIYDTPEGDEFVGPDGDCA